MYSKFDLKISSFLYNSELNKHLEVGKKIYNNHREQAKKNLKKFIYDNGHIDGTSMKDNWFQMEDVDVFISHSHQDIIKVQAFAGWLYDEFGLKAFIDSCVWGYCDELLKQIDDTYCKKSDNKTYSYELRNYTTSHVHIMLSTALTEMINKTECIMFYNTPNSVSLVDDLCAIKKQKKKVTLSPWIYHELAMTSLVKICKPERKIPILEDVIVHNVFAERNTINVEYNVDTYLNDMVLLEENELKNWKKFYQILIHQLDGEDIPYISGYEDIFSLDVLYNLPVLYKI